MDFSGFHGICLSFSNNNILNDNTASYIYWISGLGIVLALTIVFINNKKGKEGL
ncbi:hypothetical protein [Methanolobus mangrovi]|uniref:hypothetical protein n=1 Tax=Methanolobus mangrovi TaxID=3072977 RepID=UPI003873969B